jgi:hypothetical protein
VTVDGMTNLLWQVEFKIPDGFHVCLVAAVERRQAIKFARVANPLRDACPVAACFVRNDMELTEDTTQPP